MRCSTGRGMRLGDDDWRLYAAPPDSPPHSGSGPLSRRVPPDHGADHSGRWSSTPAAASTRRRPGGVGQALALLAAILAIIGVVAAASGRTPWRVTNSWSKALSHSP